jgi:hypothetical protein
MSNITKANNDVKINFDGLKNVLKFFSKPVPSVKVGILGDKNARRGEEQGNAEIGYRNEFGSFTGKVKIPKRSFIIMPLKTRLAKELKKAKTLQGKAFENAVKTGTTDQFFKKIGVVAEKVIQDAFKTRGFGQWPENAPATIALKGSDSPLIDTAQLRKSITSEVVKGKKK